MHGTTNIKKDNLLFCAGLKLGLSRLGRNIGLGYLRNIFKPKREKVIGEWRILHKE